MPGKKSEMTKRHRVSLAKFARISRFLFQNRLETKNSLITHPITSEFNVISALAKSTKAAIA